MKVERQIKDIQEEYKKSLQSEKESVAFKMLEDEQKKEEEELEKLTEAEDMKVIEELKRKVGEEEEEKREDQEYQGLLAEHLALKQQAHQIQGEWLHKQYQVREYEHLINFSAKEKDILLAQKDSLRKELDNLKDILTEIEKTN